MSRKISGIRVAADKLTMPSEGLGQNVYFSHLYQRDHRQNSLKRILFSLRKRTTYQVGISSTWEITCFFALPLSRCSKWLCYIPQLPNALCTCIRPCLESLSSRHHTARARPLQVPCTPHSPPSGRHRVGCNREVPPNRIWTAHSQVPTTRTAPRVGGTR